MSMPTPTLNLRRHRLMGRVPTPLPLLAAAASLLLLTGAEATPAKDAAFMTLKFQPWGTVSLPAGHTAGLTVNGVTIRNITRISASARREGGGWLTAGRPVSSDGFRQWIVRSRFGRLGSDALRTNASLIVYGGQGEPVTRYVIKDAWPVKMTSSGAGDLAIETLTIQAEGLELN